MPDSKNFIARPLFPKQRIKLDWTRDDYPINQLTLYQKFVRDVDWTRSPLGPMVLWPEQLRQTVLLVVADPEPAVLYWGDIQATIYNEAYIQLIGSKHPGLFGQDPRVGGFAELWDHFNNILLEGERTGKVHVAADNLVFIHRHGYLEEGYFSYKFIPQPGPEGHVVGSYATVHETTVGVIAGRRAAFIHKLTEMISPAKDVSTLWRRLLEALELNNEDLPFAMLYSHDPASPGSQPDHLSYALEGVANIPRDHKSAPSEISLLQSEGLGPAIHKAWETRAPVLLSTGDESLSDTAFVDIPWRGSQISIINVIIWPIVSGADILSFLVVGLNPRLHYNTEYSIWLHRLIEEVIAYRLSTILLAEEQFRGTMLAKEAQIEKARFFDQLREEMKFSRFADRTTVGLCITNIKGDVVYANKSWYEFSGVNPNSLSRLAWVDTVVIEDKHILEETWTKVTVHKVPHTFQCRSRQSFQAFSERIGEMSAPHKTGYCVAYPDLDEDGSIVSIMGIIVDISELKWTEDQVRLRTKALERSEAKYREFAEHAPVGLCRMSLSGEVEFANDAWIDLFRLRPTPNTKLPFLEVVHPDDVEMCQQFYNAICLSPDPITREVRLCRPWSLPGQHHVPTQSADLLISGHSECGADGLAHSLVWWATDISAQKAAARAVIDKMEEAMRQKAQQETFIDMISHEIRNPMSAILHCAEEILHSAKRCDGHYLDMKSNPEEFVCIGIDGDLTEQRENVVDAAQTILYCIEYQKRIIEDVLALSKLDADMLEFAPVPVQPMEILRHALNIFEREFKVLDIRATIKECSSLKDHGLDWVFLDPSRFLQILINLITCAINSTRESTVRDITISVSVSSQKPKSNGIDYFPPTNATAPLIDATWKSCPNGAKYLIISVTDTGKGVSEQERKSLLDRFSSPKTHVKYGEAGLGLFIARRIVEMMGGQIGITRNPSLGNSFIIFIETRKTRDTSVAVELDKKLASAMAPLSSPVVTASDALSTDYDRKLRRSSFSDPGPPKRPQRCILVVEDNLINQRVIVKQLNNHGFRVTAANHGVEALDALKRAQEENSYFDIVLCDIEMPIMNGMDCIKEIRRLEDEGLLKGHVPVLAVTANARKEHVQLALEAGMVRL
jgi:signal transduction histidine kinase/CheY-like chemotaxis protein